MKSMPRTENVELTVLCLIHQNDKYLLQNRLKDAAKISVRNPQAFYQAYSQNH